MSDREQQDRNRQAQPGQPQQDQLGGQGQQNQQSQSQQAPSWQGGPQGGGQPQSGQQQQFDAQGSGQQGGASGDSRFADQIREDQQVVDAQGNHVGTVDRVQGDQIKLTRSDSADGEHHYVQLSQVAGIEGDKVRLRERGDNDYGQEGSTGAA